MLKTTLNPKDWTIRTSIADDQLGDFEQIFIKLKPQQNCLYIVSDKENIQVLSKLIGSLSKMIDLLDQCYEEIRLTHMRDKLVYNPCLTTQLNAFMHDLLVDDGFGVRKIDNKEYDTDILVDFQKSLKEISDEDLQKMLEIVTTELRDRADS